MVFPVKANMKVVIKSWDDDWESKASNGEEEVDLELVADGARKPLRKHVSFRRKYKSKKNWSVKTISKQNITYYSLLVIGSWKSNFSLGLIRRKLTLRITLLTLYYSDQRRRRLKID